MHTFVRDARGFAKRTINVFSPVCSADDVFLIVQETYSHITTWSSQNESRPPKWSWATPFRVPPPSPAKFTGDSSSGDGFTKIASVPRVGPWTLGHHVLLPEMLSLAQEPGAWGGETPPPPRGSGQGWGEWARGPPRGTVPGRGVRVAAGGRPEGPPGPPPHVPGDGLWASFWRSRVARRGCGVSFRLQNAVLR